VRVPTDRSLASWIRELIAEGRLYRFYKTDEWLALRDRILQRSHCECEWCRDLGKYERAVTVHHVNEVKDRPELALSETYVARGGKRKRNLIALCARCHNKAHKRFQGAKARRQLNEERW
jgi:5-methylcytosine-specific restriction protein A